MNETDALVFCKSKTKPKHCIEHRMQRSVGNGRIEGLGFFLVSTSYDSPLLNKVCELPLVRS